MLTLILPQSSASNTLLSFLYPQCPSGNIVYGSHGDIYNNVNIVNQLSKSRFPVFLVNSRLTKLNYVMKIFPYKNGKVPLHFVNETRFASLRHPNIVRYLFFEKERVALLGSIPTQVSYTIMEHAENGDFSGFLQRHAEKVDDKLIRTYFRQLIEGIEYLHDNGVAHMDLKLENLLLSSDYTLKIADFDLAHYREDSMILSHGTKYYRAPEIAEGMCKNPKATDIYSAGVILFILKTRGIFPQFEGNIVDGINFSELLYNDVNKFWACHSKMQRQMIFYDDFKELFCAMTKFNPEDRSTIEAIKRSKWYKGEIYNDAELKIRMRNIPV